MYKHWNIDGKSGKLYYPEGEVVYQQPKGKVVVEALYVDENGEGFVWDEERYSPGKLVSCGKMNPWNGYYYRQDGY